MIDLHRLRSETDTILSLIKRKDPHFDGDTLVRLDKEVRELRKTIDDFRSEKNNLAKIGQQGITEELRERAKHLGSELKKAEDQLLEKDKAFKDLYLRCPNIIDEAVPQGNKEQNVVIKTHGEKPSFSFTPRVHTELAQLNGWIDFEAAAEMTGTNFALFKGDGVLTVYKIMLFMFLHNVKKGYSPLLPPFLINAQSLTGAGNFPRFADEVYKVQDEDLYLTPTSEVNLTSIYRDHIFMADELPKRMTAWTSCFRKEAGGYGAHERGLIRIHQFDKAEIYSLCHPSQSANEQERMLATAEEILQAFGLHYRVSLLAAQDCSFSSSKTYDIEVWMPGQGAYKEISSISNCTDFQARRSEIRFKETQAEKTQFVHTLNGSSLALPRLLVALMETYQNEDGSMTLPAVLDMVTVR